MILDECNQASASGVDLTLWVADKFGQTGPNPAAEIMASSQAGCFELTADLTSLGLQVDNLNTEYVLKAQFPLSMPGKEAAIAGVTLGYKLQVSAAPVTATFTDVPTSDFAFQFIEAFNKAGITVGCDTV